MTKKFTHTRIAAVYDGSVFYAKDAMNGLDLANRWAEPSSRRTLVEEVKAEQASMARVVESLEKRVVVSDAAPARSAVRRDHPLPPPPDFELHRIEEGPLADIFSLINPAMLYGRHLGLKGNVERLLADKDEKARKLYAAVETLKQDILEKRYFTARGVYRFYPCRSRGNDLLIHDPADPNRILETFTFPRQPAGERLCLSDYCRDVDSGEMDSVVFFIVTTGGGVRAWSQKWKEAGEYLRSHMLQAIAIESAEGFAEWLHQKIRKDWGFPDPPEQTIPDILKGRYRGVRVSFGYPACPNMTDQRKLFQLLKATENIGVELTEGDMMDPEASVSALIFHHPDAKYFRADG